VLGRGEVHGVAGANIAQRRLLRKLAEALTHATDHLSDEQMCAVLAAAHPLPTHLRSASLQTSRVRWPICPWSVMLHRTIMHVAVAQL